jgi:hypothetical protein
MKASLVSCILLFGLIAFACAESCVRNLYKYDPYYCAVSLKNGYSGFTSQNFRPYVGEAALTYSTYYENKLSLAILGSDRAAFYDLGTNTAFSRRFNVSLIMGNTAYSSIHVDSTSGQILYASSDIYNTDDHKAFQPFASEIHNALQNLQSNIYSNSFYPEVGHIYLINIYNNQYGETYLTKLLVLDVSPNNATVSLRWDVIDSTRDSTHSALCYISRVTAPQTIYISESDGSDITDGNNRPVGASNPIIITLSVAMSVMFVLLIVLGVLVLGAFKKMKQLSSGGINRDYYYTTPAPNSEKKPLMDSDKK